MTNETIFFIIIIIFLLLGCGFKCTGMKEGFSDSKIVTECKEPKYLCCDGNDPKDYSCDPCEECCRDDNAISSSGKKVPCPDYC